MVCPGIERLDMTYEEQVQLAARLLRLTYEETRECSRTIPETNCLYLSVPTKGGISLIVDADGSVLQAPSSMGFTRHYAAFVNGKRTSLGYFD